MSCTLGAQGPQIVGYPRNEKRKWCKMGIFDKAKDLLGSEKQTDAGLDKAEKLATDKLGEDKADQIKQARDQVDQRIGDGDEEPRGEEPREEGER